MNTSHRPTIVATAISAATIVALTTGCSPSGSAVYTAPVQCAQPSASTTDSPFSVVIRPIRNTVRAGQDQLTTTATLRNTSATAFRLNLNSSATLDGVLTNGAGSVASPTLDQVIDAGGRSDDGAKIGPAVVLAPIQPGGSVTMPVTIRIQQCDERSEKFTRSGAYRMRLLLSYHAGTVGSTPVVTALSKASISIKVP